VCDASPGTAADLDHDHDDDVFVFEFVGAGAGEFGSPAAAGAVCEPSCGSGADRPHGRWPRAGVGNGFAAGGCEWGG
jgi:hypothetical protein